MVYITLLYSKLRILTFIFAKLVYWNTNFSVKINTLGVNLSIKAQRTIKYNINLSEHAYIVPRTLCSPWYTSIKKMLGSEGLKVTFSRKAWIQISPQNHFAFISKTTNHRGMYWLLSPLHIIFWTKSCTKRFPIIGSFWNIC